MSKSQETAGAILLSILFVYWVATGCSFSLVTHGIMAIGMNPEVLGIIGMGLLILVPYWVSFRIGLFILAFILFVLSAISGGENHVTPAWAAWVTAIEAVAAVLVAINFCRTHENWGTWHDK
ncbi:MAG: hypothetical protein PHQ60_01935 [Sideroxydans sp.]|nr:hypothetical protein [Sideroxydans sp.]MDD5056602.1 hypothetical protein [Sideroxydans sp.]